jgi:hypothetical protein
VKIDVISDVVGDRLTEAWDLYETAFRDLNALTVQRHLMTRGEFDAVAADRRVEKWLAISDAGVLHGLATYTNQLDAMPLISPAYFARRWPVEYAEQRIWYCGFVAVPGHQQGVFLELITAGYRQAEELRGIIALDICRHNIEKYQLDKRVARWLQHISGGQVRCDVADTQSFFTYETAPERVGTSLVPDGSPAAATSHDGRPGMVIDLSRCGQ